MSVDCAQCISLPEELTCGYCIDTNCEFMQIVTVTRLSCDFHLTVLLSSACSMREDCNGIVSNSNMCPMNILEVCMYIQVYVH